VAPIEYLGTAVLNQNFIWRKLIRDAVPVKLPILSSRLMFKNIKIRVCKSIILPAVLYGCETWSLILREAHRLRVFENRALSRIFGPKRDEVTGGWRKLHNEELHNLYSSPSIIRIDEVKENKMGSACSTNGGRRRRRRTNECRILLRKPEGIKPVGRCGRRWVGMA
jgi:hypothetical protein